jgi:hypothetical protein
MFSVDTSSFLILQFSHGMSESSSAQLGDHHTTCQKILSVGFDLGGRSCQEYSEFKRYENIPFFSSRSKSRFWDCNRVSGCDDIYRGSIFSNTSFLDTLVVKATAFCWPVRDIPSLQPLISDYKLRTKPRPTTAVIKRFGNTSNGAMYLCIEGILRLPKFASREAIHNAADGFLTTTAIPAESYPHTQPLSAIGPARGRASGLESRKTPSADRIGTSELNSSLCLSIPFIIFVVRPSLPTPSVNVCPTYYPEYTSRSVF